MKELKTYIYEGFFSNVGGDPIKRTIDIVNKLRNIKDIKDYRSNADYWLNLCMQFPVDFGMHIYPQDKRYHLYYIKNKKGEFDWVEINSDKYSNLNDNASTSVINVANSLYIMFSDDYIVKPCYKDKNNNFKDL